MRTTVTQSPLEWQAMVDHWLDEGETWADFGMDQPNPHWAHTLSRRDLCPACWKHRELHRAEFP